MLRLLLSVLLLLSVGLTQVFADVPVFIYHRFDETRYPSTNISVETFTRQLEFLKTGGYQVLPLTEIARRVREGAPLPDKTVGLSIDDAFRSFALHAVPVLQRFGYPVTLFVNTDSVGTPGYLDWDALRALMRKGVEIGNHTASHAYLVEMEEGETKAHWRQRINEDIARSRQQLKKELQVDPQIFAYTYGEYSPEVIEILRLAGFTSAFAQQSGVISTTSSVWSLPRFPMGGAYATLEGFVDKLKMRNLEVLAEDPLDPVVRKQNPPTLQLQLKDPALAGGQINCFAQAGNSCQVEVLDRERGRLKIVGDKPLKGRRNKYTLTRLGRDGGWRWYSHLWVNAERPAPID